MGTSQGFELHNFLPLPLTVQPNNNCSADLSSVSTDGATRKLFCFVPFSYDRVAVSGPGPAYGLKTSIGTKDHCLTKSQSPAYSMGHKYQGHIHCVKLIFLKKSTFENAANLRGKTAKRKKHQRLIAEVTGLCCVVCHRHCYLK